MADLTSGLRRAETRPRATGPAVPSTAGMNQGENTITGATPSRNVGASAPAYPDKSAGSHKSNAWHEMTDVEFRAYTETMVAITIPVGGSYTLDPTRAQVWRVHVAGAATIVIPNPTFPVPVTVRQDAPERTKTWSCVLVVNVPTGAPFPTISGAKWSEKASVPNVKNPDGTTPVDFSGRYAFTFVHDPIAGDVLGFEGGLRF